MTEDFELNEDSTDLWSEFHRDEPETTKEEKPLTINFRNETQVKLWVNELAGQISDGLWENAKPYGHCEKPIAAKAICDPNLPLGPNFMTKRNYAFTSSELISVVGDRMMADAGIAKKSQLMKELRDMRLIFAGRAKR